MPKDNRNKEIERRLSILETLMNDVRKDLENIRNNHLEKIYRKLEEIEKQIYKRPGWLISGLVALLSALVVYILTTK